MAERLAVSRLASAPAQASFAEDEERASVGIRLLAYALDSIVLFAFTMLFAAVAFLNIFLRSDSGREDPTDAAIWTSVAILMATVPGWFVLNLLLGASRNQTIGQYVLGLGVLKENGRPANELRLLAYWLGLHPLLFHPLLAGFWFLLAYASVSLSQSEAAFIGSLAIGLVCVLAPVLNLVFLFIDPQRRAIHDRLAGLKVVRLD